MSMPTDPPRWTHRLVITVVLALLLVVSGSGRAWGQEAKPDAAALDPAARAAFERGIEHYSSRHYEAAIAQFQQAYRLEPRRKILFAWAQAERLRGNCQAAVELYRRFLAAAPDADEAARARDHLGRCEAVLPRPWYRDWVGNGLVASGTVSVGVGLALFVRSSSHESDAREATTYAEYHRAARAAERTRLWSLVTLGAGTALVASGITHYLVVGAGPSSSSAVVGIDPVSRMVTISGTY
jgi:tetratricopeptide (TPR) repeat protein